MRSKAIRTLKKFDRFDVLRVFLLIGANVCINRQALSKIAILGEGSVRTILKKLSHKKLIYITKKGNILSPEGRRIFEDVLSFFTFPKRLKNNVFKDGLEAYASVVRGYDREKIRELYKARDFAIRQGCNSAMVLLCTKSGSIKIPYVRKWNFDGLHKELRVLPGELVVLASSDSRRIAERGIFSMIEYLVPRLSELFRNIYS